MRTGWKIGLALSGFVLALILYLSLRPPAPKPSPHSDREELMCMDPDCGFQGVFAEAEATASVQQHGLGNRNGIDLFHCPSCRRLSLYRAAFAPLPFDAQDFPDP